MSDVVAIRFDDLRTRAVGVWGLGVEGRATLNRLAAIGVAPAALVDDHPERLTPARADVVATNEGGIDLLSGCEVVIKGPGISRHRPDARRLVDAGVVLVGGMGLWLDEVDPAWVIAVTGSKGKSTTASLIAHLLRASGREVLLAGNIGVAPWDPTTKQAAPYDDVVVEISSFQATDVMRAPSLVVVTSLSPDHLDWHGDVETYYQEKLSLCTKPGVQLVIVNGDDDELRANHELLGPHVRWVGTEGVDEGLVESFHLAGAHNCHNLALALGVLRARGIYLETTRIENSAQEFEPLASRLTHVATSEGVRFIDDSLATNVLPTLAALAAHPEGRLALLVGGQDRGIDYRPLAHGIASRQAATVVVTLPDNGRRIKEALEVGGYGGPILNAADLDEGVALGAQWCEDEGIVLLSPAAPSFGRFDDYAHRSKAFLAAAREWSNRSNRAFNEMRAGRPD